MTTTSDWFRAQSRYNRKAILHLLHLTRMQMEEKHLLNYNLFLEFLHLLEDEHEIAKGRDPAEEPSVFDRWAMLRER